MWLVWGSAKVSMSRRLFGHFQKPRYNNDSKYPVRNATGNRAKVANSSICGSSAIYYNKKGKQRDKDAAFL
jgi:hypothetical protein